MKLKVIITVITLGSMLSGIGFTIYNTFAKDEEFKALRQEYVFDKLTNMRNKVQDRIWQYEDRYGRNIEDSNDVDITIKEEYRRMRKEYEDFDTQIQEKYSE